MQIQARRPPAAHFTSVQYTSISGAGIRDDGILVKSSMLVQPGLTNQQTITWLEPLYCRLEGCQCQHHKTLVCSVTERAVNDLNESAHEEAPRDLYNVGRVQCLEMI